MTHSLEIVTKIVFLSFPHCGFLLRSKRKNEQIAKKQRYKAIGA